MRHIPLVAGERRVENGTLGRVLGVDGSTVLLDLDGRLVRLGQQDLDALRLGYAQHAYGAQGRTVDRVYALAGGWSTDRESGYVAVSRARERSEIFADYDTLGVGQGRTPLDGAAARTAAPAEEDLRGEAIVRLAERYGHSRPQLAALEALSAAGRTSENGLEAMAPTSTPDDERAARSRVHALASTKQVEWARALGGEVPPGATWVEASLVIVRLRGEPEGVWAQQLLRERVPADLARETLEIATRRHDAADRTELSGDADPRERSPHSSPIAPQDVEPISLETASPGRGACGPVAAPTPAAPQPADPAAVAPEHEEPAPMPPAAAATPEQEEAAQQEQRDSRDREARTADTAEVEAPSLAPRAEESRAGASNDGGSGPAVEVAGPQEQAEPAMERDLA
ncbi:MAG: hypothetical protein ACREQ5_27220, partial [Candidatus Dormibacteria bacterium]